MGLGWRVEWGFGLWFFHLQFHLTMVWVYMGVLRPSKWRKKKSQARADCVWPSWVPTSKHKETMGFLFLTFSHDTWRGLEWTSSHQCTSWGWGRWSRFGDEPKRHPPCPKFFFSPASILPQKISLLPTYLPPTYLPPPTSHLLPPIAIAKTSHLLPPIAIARARMLPFGADRHCQSWESSRR